MEVFSVQFKKETPKGEMNFIGAVIAFFAEMTKGFQEKTKETYIKDYNERIFPLINEALPIAEYTPEVAEDLCDRIQERNGYAEETMRGRYNHLVLDPCDAFFAQMGDNPFWGSRLKFRDAAGDLSVEEKLLKIPKSFSPKQELRIMDTIMCDPYTSQGTDIGLTMMLLSGMRNEEACGINFGDIVELQSHPGYYYLRMYETTVETGNTLKGGGKTHNAPRNIPIPIVLYHFLEERKRYVASQVTFPCKDRRGVEFQSIEEMPVACRRDEFTERCDTDDLTVAGRKLLREDIKCKEEDISGINYRIRTQENTAEDLGERDPTTYLFRRNMATHLYNLGFTLVQTLYYMGHKLEDTDLNRSDFTDEEFLYEMCVLLENHPLNYPTKEELINAEKAKSISRRNISSIGIDFPKGDTERSYLVRLKTREYGDSAEIRFRGTDGKAVIFTDSDPDKPQREGNVIQKANALYRK